MPDDAERLDIYFTITYLKGLDALWTATKKKNRNVPESGRTESLPRRRARPRLMVKWKMITQGIITMAVRQDSTVNMEATTGHINRATITITIVKEVTTITDKVAMEITAIIIKAATTTIARVVTTIATIIRVATSHANNIRLLR